MDPFPINQLAVLVISHLYYLCVPVCGRNQYDVLFLLVKLIDSVMWKIGLQASRSCLVDEQLGDGVCFMNFIVEWF